MNFSIYHCKFATILYEFCERSTIHGVGHLVDRTRHWIER